jgi:hypothetical protein
MPAPCTIQFCGYWLGFGGVLSLARDVYHHVESSKKKLRASLRSLPERPRQKPTAAKFPVADAPKVGETSSEDGIVQVEA